MSYTNKQYERYRALDAQMIEKVEQQTHKYPKYQ